MSADSNFRTSNALGVPIPVWIVKQLEKRSKELSVENGASNDNLLFRANRSSWVRMVSSVDIRKDELNDKPTTKEFIRGKADSALAKEYVLQAGISKYVSGPGDKFSYALRNGFEDTYNPLGYGVDKYGYRPMPGITSVKVTTQGRLGSIRSAEIQLKAWTKDQLDIIDTLYFKLGFTMFLEWGHTYYYDQDSTDGELKSSEDLSIDPFKIGLTKEDIYSQISSNVRKSGGNYDAMLGMVTNFNFTYNQEGGYDCTIRLIALGALMSQMKINNPKELPEILASTVKQLIKTLEDVVDRQKAAELAKQIAEQVSLDPNYEERNKYPACVRDKKRNGTLENTRNVGDKKPNQTRAIELTTKRGATYYFYPNGLCETVGLGSGVQNYVCDGENIVINGLSEAADTGTYEQFVKQKENKKQNQLYVGSQEALEVKRSDTLNNNSTTENLKFVDDSSVAIKNLDKPYAFVIEIKDENYIAFNKFKTLVPFETDLEKKYKVTSKIMLPNFTISQVINQQLGSFNVTNIPKLSINLLLDDIVNIDSRPRIIKYVRVRGLTPRQDTSSIITTSNFGSFTKDNLSLDFNKTKLRESYYYSFIVYDNILQVNANQSHTTVLAFNQIAKSKDGKSYRTSKDGKIDPQVKTKLSESLRNGDLVWTVSEISENPPIISNEGISSTNQAKINIKLKTIVSLDILTTEDTLETDAVTGAIKPKITKQENYDFDVYIFTNDIGILKTLNVEKLPFNVLDSISGEQASQNVVAETPTEPLPAINANEVQTAEAARYRSAFEIMIRTIQLYSLNNALQSNSKKVSNLSLLDKKSKTELTDKLFQIGLFGPQKGNTTSILNRVMSLLNNKEELKKKCTEYDDAILAGKPITEDLMLVRYAFGFHFGLLGGKTTATKLYEKGLNVDYNSLMTSYVVPYEFNQSIFQGATVNHPVYIPLGLVIMLLNHMCTIYDKDRPIVYIDFNSKTNICLSTPAHLSTNPYEVLIPFQGSNTDFKNIIDPSTIEGSNIKAQKRLKDESGSEDSDSGYSTTPIYTPQGTSATSDAISGGLLPFKQITTDKKDAYRGRTLNILVSCDYILETVTRFAKNNDSGDVYLKEFLEEILSNINKSLGDINVFRVAYDDSANTIHIVDDQTTPNLEDEYPEAELSTTKAEFNSRLPLFGKGTIAKSLEIKTEISSKLSNMIAISSNAKEDQSNLSKSTQQFGIYTQNYQDRYANNKTEYSSSIVASPTNTQIKSAVQFNQSITSFYGDAIPAMDSVAAATGYYIQRMSKLKGKSAATNAAPMIPVSLNFSMDGMSGFGMGQSFTVDPEFLPYSYNLSNPGDPRTVAFVMIGLDHTIENNLWTSNVRTNMIYGKKGADFEKEELKKLSATSDLRGATLNSQEYSSLVSGVIKAGKVTKEVNSFEQVTRQVIANLEGGYYSTTMFDSLNGQPPRINPKYRSIYGKSGETMFGIDRKAGGAINTTNAGKQFWSIIDAQDAANKWSYNYIPPDPLQTQLLNAAIEIMKPEFEKLFNTYVTNKELQKVITSDGRLYFNFIYATWNGPGYFKEFSEEITKAYEQGSKSSEDLLKLFIQLRLNSRIFYPNTNQNSFDLIAKGGREIARLTGVQIT